MIINGESLRSLNISFNAAFNSGFDGAESVWQKVAMDVSSSTRTEEYGWLGALPQIREWLGDRIIQGLSAYRYAITNRDFEMTISIPRNDIMDDNIGIYAPMMKEMGQRTKQFPDLFVMQLLALGFSTLCYDGQYFFDVDHPVVDANGVTQSVANTDAAPGNGPAWYLLDTSRAFKPFVCQNRMPFQFVAKDKPGDDNVFFKKEFLYGVDGRSNSGFGLWQLAWGSKQPLDDAHYSAARAAMQSLTGDYGAKLGVSPTTLVVPPALERAGRALLTSEKDAYGASNVWAGSADLIVTPWLL